MPAPLDEEARARVLRRALELADAGTPVEAADQVEVLRRVADDLGIPEPALQRALAEERAGLLVAPARRRPPLADLLAGPAEARVARPLPHQPGADPLGELDAWLQRGHALRRRSLTSDRGVWERSRGAAAALQRGAGSIVGEAALGRLDEVGAEQVDLGDEVLVRLRADLRASRAGHLAGGATVTGTGLAGVAGLTVLLGPVALVGAPLAAVAGVAVSRRHRKRVRAVERELDRLLEQIAAGERARAPLGRVVERLGGLGALRGVRGPGAGKMSRP